MPIAAFPGIGASIRISAAARFSLMSSVRLTILLTFTPISGWISYRVTDGPLLTFVIVTFTPKFFNVCCNLFAVAIKCCFESPIAFLLPSFNSFTDGNTYCFGWVCSIAASISAAISFFSASVICSAFFSFAAFFVFCGFCACAPAFSS